MGACPTGPIVALAKKLARASLLLYAYGKMTTRGSGPRGAAAARLRQRKYTLVRRLQLPAGVVEDLLPGSLSETRRRCGKPTCHCAGGEGHPSWYLTFMVAGRKRVERIPAAWVAEVQRRVERGREFKQAVAEVLAANAQLLVLERQQTGR